MKTYSYVDILKKELRDSAFREEYEALAGEFAVAKEVIRLRKANGWTQKELAERAHTSQPAIARLESGNYRNVSLSFLRKIGAALGAVPVVHMQAVGARKPKHAWPLERHTPAAPPCPQRADRRLATLRWRINAFGS